MDLIWSISGLTLETGRNPSDGRPRDWASSSLAGISRAGTGRTTRVRDWKRRWKGCTNHSSLWAFYAFLSPWLPTGHPWAIVFVDDCNVVFIFPYILIDIVQWNVSIGPEIADKGAQPFHSTGDFQQGRWLRWLYGNCRWTKKGRGSERMFITKRNRLTYWRAKSGGRSLRFCWCNLSRRAWKLGPAGKRSGEYVGDVISSLFHGVDLVGLSLWASASCSPQVTFLRFVTGVWSWMPWKMPSMRPLGWGVGPIDSALMAIGFAGVRLSCWKVIARFCGVTVLRAIDVETKPMGGWGCSLCSPTERRAACDRGFILKSLW